MSGQSVLGQFGLDTLVGRFRAFEMISREMLPPGKFVCDCSSVSLLSGKKKKAQTQTFGSGYLPVGWGSYT